MSSSLWSVSLTVLLLAVLVQPCTKGQPLHADAKVTLAPERIETVIPAGRVTVRAWWSTGRL